MRISVREIKNPLYSKAKIVREKSLKCQGKEEGDRGHIGQLLYSYHREHWTVKIKKIDFSFRDFIC